MKVSLGVKYDYRERQIFYNELLIKITKMLVWQVKTGGGI